MNRVTDHQGIFRADTEFLEKAEEHFGIGLAGRVVGATTGSEEAVQAGPFEVTRTNRTRSACSATRALAPAYASTAEHKNGYVESRDLRRRQGARPKA